MVCPRCSTQSPASVDFTRFQHLCCVHNVEVPVHDCTLCAEPQTMANSVALPCCHQRIHYWCLVHSVHACGDGCPFCTRDLLPFLTDPFVATSLAHHNLSLDLQRAPSNSLVNSLHGPNLPPEPDIWPLCCFRTGGPPDFAPVDDRRMEWSPLQPTAQGRSSEWTPQWICRSCGCSSSMDDIPTMDIVSCPTCSSAPGVVFDRPTGRAVRFCVPCRREVTTSTPRFLPCSPAIRHSTSDTQLVHPRSPQQIQPIVRMGISPSHAAGKWLAILAFLPFDLAWVGPCRIPTRGPSLLHWKPRPGAF